MSRSLPNDGEGSRSATQNRKEEKREDGRKGGPGTSLKLSPRSRGRTRFLSTLRNPKERGVGRKKKDQLASELESAIKGKNNKKGEG